MDAVGMVVLPAEVICIKPGGPELGAQGAKSIGALVRFVLRRRAQHFSYFAVTTPASVLY